MLAFKRFISIIYFHIQVNIYMLKNITTTFQFLNPQNLISRLLSKLQYNEEAV